MSLLFNYSCKVSIQPLFGHESLLTDAYNQRLKTISLALNSFSVK